MDIEDKKAAAISLLNLMIRRVESCHTVDELELKVENEFEQNQSFGTKECELTGWVNFDLQMRFK